MTYSLLASTANQGSGTSVTTTAINATGAKLIVLVNCTFGNGAAITDSSSNSWASSGLTLWGTPNGTGCIRIHYLINPTVSSSYQVFQSGSGDYMSMAVLAYSCTGTPVFDQQTGAVSSGGVGFLATGSVTPAANDELCVGGWGWDTHLPNTINAGTILHSLAIVGGTAWAITVAHEIQTTATTRNFTLDHTPANAGMNGAFAFFKESGGGGGGGTHTANRSFQSVMG